MEPWTLEGEAWRAVPGWAGMYEVSDLGRVRSLRRYRCKGRILRFGTTHNGYLTATFSGNGRREARTVHRIVAEAFIGPRPADMHTCHIDGDQTNNAVTNLRYATQAENERDKRRHGTQHNLNKTHCPYGHPYSGDNLVGRGNGGRRCKTCHREQQQARRLAAKGLLPLAS